jgi:putative FmdB family regulatory protein
MPIYEYECSACGHQFEEWQKMSDSPVRTCPKCKKKKVERLISQTAFQLKGGGWYADLYSSSKPGKGSASEPGGKDGGSKDAGTSKDGGSKDSGGSGGSKDSGGGGGKDTGGGGGKDTSTKADSGSKKETKTAAKKSDTRAA